MCHEIKYQYFDTLTVMLVERINDDKGRIIGHDCHSENYGQACGKS